MKEEIRKWILVVVVMSFLSISPVSAIHYNSLGGDDGVLDQQQTTHDGGLACVGEDAFAQEFTPSMNFLTKIELLIMRNVTVLPGFEIKIRDALDGRDLRSIEPPDFAPDEYQWIEFDFDDLQVTPGKSYYIIFDGYHGGHPTQTYYWGYGISEPVDLYPSGESYFYDESDDEWLPFSYFYDYDIDFCFKTYGLSVTPPDTPEKPSGDTVYLVPGVEYTFCTSTHDPDGDPIYYWFDWGDGTDSGWLGPYESGAEVCASHIWDAEGSYDIRVKAADDRLESDWSEPLAVYVDISSPQVTIENPREGYLHILGRHIPIGMTVIVGSINIKVHATDISGIEKVEFYINDLNRLKSTDTEEPYEWLWDETTIGRYVIIIKAYDNAGNSPEETQMNVLIFNI